LDEFILQVVAKIETTIIDVEQKLTQVHFIQLKKMRSIIAYSNDFLFEE
jgi:hypothetical protein